MPYSWGKATFGEVKRQVFSYLLPPEDTRVKGWVEGPRTRGKHGACEPPQSQSPKMPRKMVPGTWKCWTRNKTSWAAKPKNGNSWFSESLRVRFPQLLFSHTPVSSDKTALPAPSWGMQLSVQPARTWGMCRPGVCHFGLRSLKLSFPFPSSSAGLREPGTGALGAMC